MPQDEAVMAAPRSGSGAARRPRGSGGPGGLGGGPGVGGEALLDSLEEGRGVEGGSTTQLEDLLLTTTSKQVAG